MLMRLFELKKRREAFAGCDSDESGRRDKEGKEVAWDDPKSLIIGDRIVL
jgi:hypothetical protein